MRMPPKLTTGGLVNVLIGTTGTKNKNARALIVQRATTAAFLMVCDAVNIALTHCYLCQTRSCPDGRWRRLKQTSAQTLPMGGFTRQAANSDVASLVYLLFSLLLFFIVFYWFYRILKRMEKTLLEIKQLLQGKKMTNED